MEVQKEARRKFWGGGSPPVRKGRDDYVEIRTHPLAERLRCGRPAGGRPGRLPSRPDPASSGSSVVTDYPPVSTPTTEPSGSATTTESTGPEIPVRAAAGW